MNKENVVHTHTLTYIMMEYYSAIKKKSFMLRSDRGRQEENDKQLMISLTYGILKKNTENK